MTLNKRGHGKLREKALDHTLWKTRTTEYRMNKCYFPCLTFKLSSNCSVSKALTLYLAV